MLCDSQKRANMPKLIDHRIFRILNLKRFIVQNYYLLPILLLFLQTGSSFRS